MRLLLLQTFCSFSIFTVFHLSLLNALVIPWIQTDRYILDIFGSQELSITTQSQYWMINGITNSNRIKGYMCNGVSFLGGIGILNVGDYLERTYDSLPSHDMISYFVRFLIIDNWQPSEQITLSFKDTNHVFSFVPAGVGIADNSNTSYCGNSTFSDQDLFRVKGIFFHNMSTLTVKVSSNLATSVRSYGFRGIRLSFRQKSPTDTQKSCVELSYPALSPTFSEKCDCPQGKYLDGANSCQPCHASCLNCYGPTSKDCHACNAWHSFDGQECVRCTANCELCSGSNNNQCNLCSTSHILSSDSTCQSSCNAPSALVEMGDFKICTKTSCQLNGTFLYPNGTCLSDCLVPYKQRIEGMNKYCDKPCVNDSQFWKFYNNSTNGSCITECPSPYKVSTDGTIKICERPCDSLLEYYYEDMQKCNLGCDYPYKKEGDAICIKDLSSQDSDQIKAIRSILNATGAVKLYVGTTVSLINFGNPAAYLLEAMTNMLKYIRYMKITYPPMLQAVLDVDIEAPFNVIPQIPDKIVTILPSKALPEKFEENELHSSFIYNFWNSGITLMVILLSIILTCLFEKLSRRCKPVNSYFLKLKDALKWNFFLGYFSSLIGEIVLSTSFQLETLSLSSAIGIIDLSTCIFLNLIVFVVLTRMVFIVLQFRRLIKQSTLNISKVSPTVVFSSYEVILEPYKHKILIQQVCMCIFIVRSYLFNLVIAYLFDYPLVQAAMITGLSVLMVLYLAIFRPYKQTLDLIQYILQEVVMLVVNVCVMVLAIFDASNNQDFEKRRVLGDVVIYSNLVFSMIGVLYLVFQFIKIIMSLIKTIRNYIKDRRLKDELKKATSASQSHRSRLSNRHKHLRPVSYLASNDNLNQNSYPTQGPPTIKLTGMKKRKATNPHNQNNPKIIAKSPNLSQKESFSNKSIDHESIEDKGLKNVKIYRPTQFKQVRKITRQLK